MKDQDLAVSFQNNGGAQYTWDKICEILGKDPSQTEPNIMNNNNESSNANEGDYSP